MFFEDFLMPRNGYNNNKFKGKILEELFIMEFGYYRISEPPHMQVLFRFSYFSLFYQYLLP